MPIIVTHCDIHFLSRAVALISSILETSGTKEIWVYTHDTESFRILNLLALKNVTIISSDVLANSFSELQGSREVKNYMEYIYALTPFMILYAAEKTKDSVWYIDADVYFLKSFSHLEKQVNNKSILVTAHNFPSRLKYLEKYGKFNVGIIFVSGDEESLETVRWWAVKCIENTSTFSKEDVYGDQKYLDEFPSHNSNFHVFKPVDCCAAPWNIELINDLPPVTFHYSGLRRYRYFSFLGLSRYFVKVDSNYRSAIYAPYNDRLDKIEKEIFGGLKFDTRKISRNSWMRMIFSHDVMIRLWG